MMENFYTQENQLTLKTACGREFAHVFKAIKLMRDERHTFHVVYKTFSDEYVYSYCNPLLETQTSHTYEVISETEAKRIFLQRLSQDNARDLFSSY